MRQGFWSRYLLRTIVELTHGEKYLRLIFAVPNASRTYAVTENTKYVVLVKSLVGCVRCKKYVHYCQIISLTHPTKMLSQKPEMTNYR